MAIETPIPETVRSDNMDDLVQLYEQAQSVLDATRGVMLSPTAEKQPPRFTVKQLCELCNIDRDEFKRLDASGALPTGHKDGRGHREFLLCDAREWIKAHRQQPRPEGAVAATIAVGNFKGGVTKTTTTMSLAQGLSLRGYDVLVIDLDPQASLTNLFGIIPDTEVDAEQTALPLFMGTRDSLRYAVCDSYWDGIDFVPAMSMLYNAEFHLPSQQVKLGKNYQFWDLLNAGLHDVREHYDVILIDTAPALSYSTVNAFMAADGLIVPLPPSALDFASSVQFWSLFTDLATHLSKRMAAPKVFDFTRILFTRVDSSDAAATAVRQWIRQAYGDRVMDTEIPKSSVAMAAAAEFGTVYDLNRFDGDKRTYQRIRDEMDGFVQTIDGVLLARWNAMSSEQGASAPRAMASV